MIEQVDKLGVNPAMEALNAPPQQQKDLAYSIVAKDLMCTGPPSIKALAYSIVAKDLMCCEAQSIGEGEG